MIFFFFFFLFEIEVNVGLYNKYLNDFLSEMMKQFFVVMYQLTVISFLHLNKLFYYQGC